MTEPNATTAGILAGAGIGLAGSIMGAQIDALIMGLIAAVFASIWLPSINDRLRAASAVAVSTLMAGYGSPVLAAWLASTQEGLSAGHELRMFLAVVIGATCPVMTPALVDRAKAWIAQSGLMTWGKK